MAAGIFRPMEIRFGVQDAPHRSKPVASQRMVNCYLEAPLPGSKSPAPVVSSYGISQFANLTDLKGGNTIAGVPYVQTATGLYSLSSAGTATLLATNSASGDAIVEGDGISVLVQADQKAWIYDGTLTQITDADFPTPAWMGYVDGYFPTIEKDSGRFYINTTPFVPQNWDALDFATAEGNPDNLLWGLIDHREVILFGQETTEIWYNSGDATFPFERVPNGFIEIGIFSARAAGKLNDTVFFLGSDGIAYQLNGYQPIPISHVPFSQAIDGYTKDCRVMTWHEAGHPLVAFKFPEACWVYDLSTQLWHNRQTYGSDTWDVDWVIRAYGQYLTGGSTVGKLVPDVFTEYGGIMRAQCTSAAIADRNALLSHDRLELLFETGNEGTVMLRFSDNGGRTWSNEKTASLGATGEYGTRVLFHRLGSSRDRVYEYAISDPYRRTLIAASLNEWG